MKKLIKRFQAPTPVYFARLSKRLKAIGLSCATLGIAIYANQEHIYPVLIEIGKIATIIGTFGPFIGSIICDLTTTENE